MCGPCWAEDANGNIAIHPNGVVEQHPWLHVRHTEAGRKRIAYERMCRDLNKELNNLK